MNIAVFPTVIAAFDSLVRNDPTRPLVTFYDDALGDRTELSAATLANWVAKTANMLVDATGIVAGDTAAIRLPAHWQTSAVLLGCWAAGLVVDLETDPDGTPGRGASAGTPAAVAFVTADRAAPVDAGEVYALALAPLAAPCRAGPPPGTLDYVVAVRGHGDRFVPPWPVEAGTVALADATTHGQLVAVAAARRVPPAARLLIDGDAHPDPVDWLLAPLVAGSSIVLCRNLDPAALDHRLVSEHAAVC